MAVDLKITVSKTVTRKFKLSEETAQMLDNYIAAAKDNNPGAESWQVVDAILQHHFGKDREFKKWLKEKREAEAKAKTSLRPVSDSADQAVNS